MKSVQDEILRQQQRFAQQPFFRRLEQEGPMEHALAFVPGLTFFVMAFQDMLRINEVRVSDPALLRIARHHRLEDQGHEQWFLRDMAKLGTERDIRWLFGPEHAATRDASYALLSEVIRANDDRLRIVLLLVLEATGEVFFSRIPGYIERAGYRGAAQLEYFSRSHHETEKNHILFEREMHASLIAVELPSEIRTDALALVERSFTAMRSMVDELEARIVRQDRGARRLHASGA